MVSLRETDLPFFRKQGNVIKYLPLYNGHQQEDESMEWIATMQRAIAYMEEHLLEEINYEDVASKMLEIFFRN